MSFLAETELQRVSWRYVAGNLWFRRVRGASATEEPSPQKPAAGTWSAIGMWTAATAGDSISQSRHIAPRLRDIMLVTLVQAACSSEAGLSFGVRYVPRKRTGSNYVSRRPSTSSQASIFHKFANCTIELWDQYFAGLEDSRLNGRVTPSDTLFMYPRLVLCTISARHFIVELLGYSWNPCPLILKRHREPSLNRYFYQFSQTDMKGFFKGVSDIRCSALTGCYVSPYIHEHIITKRFPFLIHAPPECKILATPSVDANAAVEFCGDAHFYHFDNCILINKYKDICRLKHIRHVVIVKKNVDVEEYRNWMRSLFNTHEPWGVRAVRKIEQYNIQNAEIAGQFANLYLFPELRETTIGEFLKLHPEFVCEAFDTGTFVCEPRLVWMEGAKPEDEEFVKPDLMIKRDDGFYDIYDLKRPLTRHATIVKGPRRRRRFIDYVSEGIAQLAHYAEYFAHDRNRRYAEERYGIRIKEPSAQTHSDGSVCRGSDRRFSSR
jgi:hypothetical protein